MSVETVYAFGNPNIGVYVSVSEKAALIPIDAPEKVEKALENALKVEVYRCTVYGSPLLGVLSVMNSNGLIVGKLVRDEELRLFKKLLGDSLVIEVLDVKENAVGNLVLANDKGALVSKKLPGKCVSQIADALDIEVARADIAGSYLVGALGVATNKGVLLTPLASEEEVAFVESVLRVEKADVGTVNRGNIFVRSGLAANSKGALVGYETTGPELMRISTILF